MLERCAYSSANHLIGLAPGIIREANDKGVPKDKCTLIPNGCDEEFKGQPRALSDKVMRMVYAGAHGRANGLYQILDVAIELKSRGCDQIQIIMELIHLSLM